VIRVSAKRLNHTDKNAVERTNEIRDRRNEVLSWIRENPAVNESNNQRQRILEGRVAPGTGDWLLQEALFKLWSDPQSGMSDSSFWLSGGPGAGKSVMCSHAVRHMKQTQPSSVVAFYYYDDRDTLKMVYQKIAEQLFYELYGSLEDVSDMTYEIAQGLSGESALKDLVKTFMTELSMAYLFLDGFDEAIDDKDKWEDAKDIMQFFRDLSKSEPSFRLWCSSIDRRGMQDLMVNTRSIHLDASTNGRDIETYLIKEALESPIFEELDNPTKNIFLQDLKSQVKGNFLWASMMVETIREDTSYTTYSEIQDMIKDGLPGDFEKYLERRITSLKRTSSGIPT